MSVGEILNSGGHRVKSIAGKTTERQKYRCVDCGNIGDWHVFTTGIDGCPGRPESLNILSVCPGGDNCVTHMDQNSAEWRMWKESPSMDAALVPRYTCKETERGTRAAAHFKDFARRLGMTTDLWSLNTDAVFNINGETFRVASFFHETGAHEVWVTKEGKIHVQRVPSGM